MRLPSLSTARLPMVSNLLYLVVILTLFLFINCFDNLTELPYNDYFEYYGPDFRLHINPSNMANQNTPEYLEKVKTRLFENLRMLPHAPGVQMQGTNGNQSVFLFLELFMTRDKCLMCGMIDSQTSQKMPSRRSLTTRTDRIQTRESRVSGGAQTARNDALVSTNRELFLLSFLLTL